MWSITHYHLWIMWSITHYNAYIYIVICHPSSRTSCKPRYVACQHSDILVYKEILNWRECMTLQLLLTNGHICLGGKVKGHASCKRLVVVLVQRHLHPSCILQLPFLPLVSRVGKHCRVDCICRTGNKHSPGGGEGGGGRRDEKEWGEGRRVEG